MTASRPNRRLPDLSSDGSPPPFSRLTLSPSVPYKDKSLQRQAQRESQRRKRERRKQLALLILGGECVECEATEDLQTDHLEPETKEFGLLGGAGPSKPIEEWLEEIDKCQLLCQPCHEEKTRKDLQGNRPGNRRLRDGEAWLAKKLLDQADLTHAEIGRLFRVPRQTIADISAGRSYVNVEGP